MMAEAISIIYEEPHFLLVNKPAGLFSQAAPGVPSLETQLIEQIKVRDEHPGRPFIGLPHRLDRATSGIMLIARNKRALTRFGEQFQSRKVNKFYLALVEGELPAGIQLWEDYVRKITDQPQAEIVEPQAEQAKQAQMLIQSICFHQGQTLALIQLLTGRMHQIRVQAARRGFPVVGDALYAAQGTFGPTSTDSDDPRQLPHALHALRLEFRHPQTARAVSYTARPPLAWRSLVSELQSAVDELVARSDAEQAQSWQFAASPQ